MIMKKKNRNDCPFLDQNGRCTYNGNYKRECKYEFKSDCKRWDEHIIK